MDLIENTRSFVSNILADEPSTHGMSHVERVESMCMNIQRYEGGDVEVLRLAALLHDVGVAKEHREGGDHAEYSAQIAREFLSQNGVRESLIDHVVACITTHRFSRGHKAGSLEAQILQDADRIDALGAVGIFRSLVSMGVLRGLKYAIGTVKESSMNAYASDPFEGFADYMENKPFKIPGTLNTNAAKMIAEDRLRVMHLYRDALAEETSLE